MYLLNNHKDGLSFQALTSWRGVAIPIPSKMRSLFQALTGEEKPRSMGVLLLAFVVSVHLCAAIWMLQPSEPITLTKPMPMEVSMVAAPSQPPVAKPIAQPKPVEPKKPPAKKPDQKKTPVIRKQIQPPKPLPLSEAMLPAPSTSQPAPEPVAASPAPSVSTKTSAKNTTFTEADFKANYGSNPKPKYPAMATSEGWEGTVRLLVKVSAEGKSEEVTVQHSSGHDMLDEAAIEAVEKWTFIPAKRGDTTVSSSVIVPINFILNH